MSRSSPPRIAIIGAGMAGITCALELQALGCRPVVLEKSRGIGGRLATRRTVEGDCFDHGAQYITARQPDFQQLLQALQKQHSVAEWSPVDSARSTLPPQPWMVGTPGMSALLKPLAATLELHTESRITGLRRSAAGWQLHSDTQATSEPFDAVVCTAPAVQCHALLTDFPAMQAALSQVNMAPCWAVMLRYAEPLPVSFDARRYQDAAIGWLARQSSRPGHAGLPHAWVLHASAAWSQQHLEDSAEQVLATLQRELAYLLGTTLPNIGFAAAHRWRHALTTAPLGQPFLAHADGSLYAAGDWCLGARVESAYASGKAVAAALAARFEINHEASDA